MAGFRG
jgi:DNA-directed RNA polymerase subunit RPC12/RpoP